MMFGLCFNDDEFYGVLVLINGIYVFGGKCYLVLLGMYVVVEVCYLIVMLYVGIGYGY